MIQDVQKKSDEITIDANTSSALINIQMRNKNLPDRNTTELLKFFEKKGSVFIDAMILLKNQFSNKTVIINYLEMASKNLTNFSKVRIFNSQCKGQMRVQFDEVKKACGRGCWSTFIPIRFHKQYKFSVHILD
jgi:hypothetical protein